MLWADITNHNPSKHARAFLGPASNIKTNPENGTPFSFMCRIRFLIVSIVLMCFDCIGASSWSFEACSYLLLITWKTSERRGWRSRLGIPSIRQIRCRCMHVRTTSTSAVAHNKLHIQKGAALLYFRSSCFQGGLAEGDRSVREAMALLQRSAAASLVWGPDALVPECWPLSSHSPPLST